MDDRDRKGDRPTVDETVDTGRRGFLRAAGLAGAGTAAAAMGGAALGETRQFPPEPGRTRYRLTPHIERFYALNRL